MIDEKAKKILFDTYWSSEGWIRNPYTPPEDLIYAIEGGFMFEPIKLTHGEIINWLGKSFKSVNLQSITNAFLTSLSTRRLELRSALGSYAIARLFPSHGYDEYVGSYCCSICGSFKNPSPIDLSVQNFERYKWGGVQHDNPEYIAFDLELFSRSGKTTPNNEDLGLMKQIIEIAKNIEADARPRDLEKKLAKVLQSNKQEREILIQILGYCGILQSKDHPGYFQKFIHYWDRKTPPVNKIDWTYPVCWWRGRDGVNLEALAFYFPDL